MDLCNHRLRNRLDRRYQLDADIEQLSVENRISVKHLAEVVPSAEGGSVAPQDHHCTVFSSADLPKRLGELLHELQRKSVSPLGTIHRYQGNRSFAINENVFGHCL